MSVWMRYAIRGSYHGMHRLCGMVSHGRHAGMHLWRGMKWRVLCGNHCGMYGILRSMGRKTSVWLPDDLEQRVKDAGVPIAELIRRGLEADAPSPLEERLAAVVRAEFEARFRPGSAVMPDLAPLIMDAVGVADEAPVRRPREKAPKASAPVAPAGTAVFAEPGAPPVVTSPVPELPAVVTPSLRRASDLKPPPRCPHAGVRQIGGWCSKCQANVAPGGKLPEGWVAPEGWSAK